MQAVGLKKLGSRQAGRSEERTRHIEKEDTRVFAGQLLKPEVEVLLDGQEGPSKGTRLDGHEHDAGFRELSMTLRQKFLELQGDLIRRQSCREVVVPLIDKNQAGTMDGDKSVKKME